MPQLKIDNKFAAFYEDDDYTDPWREAPVMLLQHGFSRSSKFWYNWVPALGREFRILRPDMRGMGQSTISEADYIPDLATFTGDIIRLLDHLGIPEIVYVGESFGGIIGLSFAHTYPERTRALVLCNTPCRLPRREEGGHVPGGDWDQTMAQGIGAWSTATINMRLDPHVSPQGLKDWYISEMDQTSSTIGRKLQTYLDTLDFRPHLPEVQVPTLLLSGEESPTATADQQRFMEEHIPNCKLVVYPKLGHGVNVLYPDWCAHQIREFLALRA